MVKYVRVDLPDDIFEALSVFCGREGISKRAGAALLITQALNAELAAELGDKHLEYEVPGWGGWRGNGASIEALMRAADKATDYGRNDPAEMDQTE